jgi:putative phosphoribosyl transferase
MMMQFEDRIHAGCLLAMSLASYRGKHPLVLAIPRGGVPLGRVIADSLGGELDVVLVHKLGAPASSEVAIGSVSEDGEVTLGTYARELEVSEDYLKAEIAAQTDLLHQRRAMYTPVKPPADPAGRTVLVVDDGLATGLTMIAALQAVRARKPAHLVAAVPVSPPDTLEKVRALADDTVCLHVPRDFGSVGRFYGDYSAVTDDEVVELLRPSRKAYAGVKRSE